MDHGSISFLAHEARALLGRADAIRPFVLTEAMPPAANLSRPAQSALEAYFAQNRRVLRKRILAYLAWLASDVALAAPAHIGQRRFSVVRLQFNRVLTQFDLFADAISQRSERDTGVWLAGLDELASDALSLPGHYQMPPLICYLDRGIGAAIRRARTRLPGGGNNPVAIIRVPRERMIGTGVASSLIHEVGHQAAALLDLVASLRLALRKTIARFQSKEAAIWAYFERWISEIVADFWSVARIGIASTAGLIGVVSLPRAFVFRIGPDDPHPVPWLRVKLSCAIGERLYPDPQWARLRKLWEGFYPPMDNGTERAELIKGIEARIPAFIDFLTSHRPPALGGASLAQAMQPWERHPKRLRKMRNAWLANPKAVLKTSPSLAVATLGQARFDGELSPGGESRALRKMLEDWALAKALRPDTRSTPLIQQPALSNA